MAVAAANCAHFYAELEKAVKQLKPDLQKEMLENLNNLKRNDKKSLSILLTGKTGAGKSTLTNGILGLKWDDKKAAKEGGGPKHCTTEVTPYQQNKNGVKVTVWDSPGLQDGTKHQGEYIQQMKKKCSKVDLVMLCVSMKETRFVEGSDNPDVVAMIKLTDAFGHEFWQKVVIILTYANILEGLNVHWRKLNDAAKAKAFDEKIGEWEEQIKKVLLKNIHVPKSTVNNLTIVPAGHIEDELHLPGIEYWLSNVWFRCLFTMKSPEARGALLQMNITRLKGAEDIHEEDFSDTEAEEQPIVVTENTVRNALMFGGGVGGAGGIIGGVIGGFTGGPFGAAIGAGIGALLGGGLGVGKVAYS